MMFFLFSFEEWWPTLSTAQHVFWIIALVFSMLFVILFGLSVLGLGADTDTDVDVDADMDTDFDVDTHVDIHVDHAAGHEYGLDKEFSAFSIRSIIAFFTFFGWTGVYLLSQGRSVMFASLIGMLTGGTAMFVVAYMIYQFAKLEKSGTVDVFNALDHMGEVYLSIPENLEGTGKIHIVVDGSLHEFDAETRGLALPTGSQVRVIEVMENEVLLVEPLMLEQPGANNNT